MSMCLYLSRVPGFLKFPGVFGLESSILKITSVQTVEVYNHYLHMKDFKFFAFLEAICTCTSSSEFSVFTDKYLK